MSEPSLKKMDGEPFIKIILKKNDALCSGNQAQSDCQSCEPGLVCNGRGLTEPNEVCSAGYYCRGGAKNSKPLDAGATGDICPKGHYCPEGTGKNNRPIKVLFLAIFPLAQQ